MEPPSSR